MRDYDAMWMEPVEGDNPWGEWREGQLLILRVSRPATFHRKRRTRCPGK